MDAVERVLWDVSGEHLDDAAFLWEQWEQALTSATQTVEELAQGTEETLNAHLDALVVGGSQVCERLLLPALAEADEPNALAAVAWVLLRSEAHDYSDAVVRALESITDEPLLQGVLRGVELSGRTDLLSRCESLRRAEAPLQRMAFRRLADAWGQSSLEEIALTLRCDATTPDERAAALRALIRTPSKGLMSEVEAAYSAEDVGVRRAAIAAGVLTHSPYVWQACRRAVQSERPEARDCLTLLAFRQEPSDWELLAGCLDSGVLRAHAAWALGYWGTIDAADACARLMANEELAPVAADSFHLITGLRIENEFERIAEADDSESLDDEADLPELKPEYDLARPEPVAIARWWAANRSGFRRASRYVLGQPVTCNALRAALVNCSMWRRPPFALELAARTGVYLDTATWAREQCRVLGNIGFGPTGNDLLHAMT